MTALRDQIGLVWDGSDFGTPGGRLLDLYAGTPRFREMLESGAETDEILAAFASDADDFRERRKKFMLY